MLLLLLLILVVLQVPLEVAYGPSSRPGAGRRPVVAASAVPQWPGPRLRLELSEQESAARATNSTRAASARLQGSHPRLFPSDFYLFSPLCSTSLHSVVIDYIFSTDYRLVQLLSQGTVVSKPPPGGRAAWLRSCIIRAEP